MFDEPPIVGHEANVEAWHGYFTSWPRYVIYPWRISARDQTVASKWRAAGCTNGTLVQTYGSNGPFVQRPTGAQISSDAWIC